VHELVIKIEYNNMHGERIKIINAQQAKLYNNFKNTKCKLLRTNAAIQIMQADT